MKKLFLFSVLATLLFCGSVYAKSGSSSYNDPILTPELNFSASLNYSGYVDTSWSVYAPDGFNYYKVVRSTTNPDPVYPDDGYIKYISDKNDTNFMDKSVPKGTVYYRVCSIAKPNRYCSSVVMIEIGDSGAGTVYEEKVEEKKYEEKKAEKPVSVGGVFFKDIGYHQYKNSINYVLEKEIVEGYESQDGGREYRPDHSINRAEFIKILVEALFGEEFHTADFEFFCFPDIDSDEWYAPYVCFAKLKKIIGGYPDGTFRPNHTINFVEAAKILVEIYNLDIPAADGEWYSGYVKALQNKKYIPLSVDSLDKTLNRGEMAEMIWRASEGKTDQGSPTLLHDPISTNPEEFSGWQTFQGSGYSFYYPSDWYSGVKRGWDYLSEEKDYIDNLHTPYYMNVDTYIVTYAQSVSASASDDEVLRPSTYFDHPEIASQSMVINGLPALRRHFRAPRGTVVNGRTTGENEVIIQYTYRNGSARYVVQYFNAAGREDYGVENFDKIAQSVSGN